MFLCTQSNACDALLVKSYVHLKRLESLQMDNGYLQSWEPSETYIFSGLKILVTSAYISYNQCSSLLLIMVRRYNRKYTDTTLTLSMRASLENFRIFTFKNFSFFQHFVGTSLLQMLCPSSNNASFVLFYVCTIIMLLSVGKFGGLAPNTRAANLWKHKLVLSTSKISIFPSKFVFFFNRPSFQIILFWDRIDVLTQRKCIGKAGLHTNFFFLVAQSGH